MVSILTMMFMSNYTCDTSVFFILTLIGLLCKNMINAFMRFYYYLKIFTNRYDTHNKVANDEETQRIEEQDIENQRVQQHNEAFYAER